MNTPKYRFYEIRDGIKMYQLLTSDDILLTDSRAEATLFTERDWQNWKFDDTLHCEEIGEDEKLRLIGAPVLPGLEAV